MKSKNFSHDLKSSNNFKTKSSFSWYNDKYRSGKRRLKFSWLSDEERERVYNILKDKGYDVRNYFDNFDRLVVYLDK